MTCCASPNSNVPAISINTTGTAAELLTTLSGAETLPLVFRYDGREIGAAFHVTEIKAAQQMSIDCGSNRETWSEITFQLLDIAGPESGRMKIGKFLGIATKAISGLKADLSAALSLEVGRGDEAMRLYSLGALSENAGRAIFDLQPRSAVCKPQLRTAVVASTEPSCCSGERTGACCN